MVHAARHTYLHLPREWLKSLQNQFYSKLIFQTKFTLLWYVQSRRYRLLSCDWDVQARPTSYDVNDSGFIVLPSVTFQNLFPLCPLRVLLWSYHSSRNFVTWQQFSVSSVSCVFIFDAMQKLWRHQPPVIIYTLPTWCRILWITIFWMWTSCKNVTVLQNYISWIQFSLNSTQVTPVSPFNQLRFPRNILPEVMVTTSYFAQSLQFNSLDRCPMAFSFLQHLWLSTTVIKWPCSILIQDVMRCLWPTQPRTLLWSSRQPTIIMMNRS